MSIIGLRSPSPYEFDMMRAQNERPCEACGQHHGGVGEYINCLRKRVLQFNGYTVEEAKLGRETLEFRREVRALGSNPWQRSDSEKAQMKGYSR